MKLTRFYLSNSLFCAARMGIGATSVVYMLSHGVKYSDIALVKLIQAVVIFFAEIPTGFVADHFGRKTSILMATVSAIVSFCLYIFLPQIWGFSFAEIFNALAICFWSGAFEALAIDSTQIDKKQGFAIESFFAKMASFSSLSIMLGGLIGGLIADIELVYSFYFSISLMVISFFSIVFLLHEKREKKEQNSSSIRQRTLSLLSKMVVQKKNAFKFASSSEKIRNYFIFQICIQFAMQPVFHYWQPYFKSFDSSVSEKLLGLIFFSYVLSQTVFSSFVSYLYDKKDISPQGINMTTIILTLISFIGLSLSSSLYTGVAYFILLQGTMTVYRNNIGASFNREVESENRALILSSVSFISRFGMFFHLIILQLITNYIPIKYSYLISSVAIFVIFIKSLKTLRTPEVLSS